MESEEPTKQELSRRNFLSVVIAAIGSAITAILGIPAVAYLVGPALQAQTEEWTELGSVKKVETGTPTLFSITLQHQTGWVTSQEEVSAYVLTEDGQNYVALSNICSHLGCRVRWIPDQNQFICPCHNGIFNKDGTVVSGPPPRPMDRFPTKLDDKGNLFIKRG